MKQLNLGVFVNFTIRFYRFISAFGAVVIPLYGFSLAAENNATPLYTTSVLSLICIIFFIVSFFSSSFKKNIAYYAFSLFLLISLQDLYLLYVNELDIEFFLSFLMGMFALSVVIEKIRLLQIYYGIIISVFLGIIFFNLELAQNESLYLVTTLSTAAFLYIILHSRATTQKKLKEKTEELNRFIYQSSHDLRGPVSTIQGLVRVADKLKNEEDYPQYFAMINTCAKRLDTILRSLIEIKAEKVKETVLQQEICFKKRIGSVIDQLSKEANLSGIQFKVNVKQDCVYVANAKLVDIILNNIIENAVIHNGGMRLVLNIDVREKGNNISIVIADNGKGLPKGKEKQAFAMFNRLSKAEGFGLGLYMVKNAVEKLNGKISLKNNGGLRYDIQLPIH